MQHTTTGKKILDIKGIMIQCGASISVYCCLSTWTLPLVICLHTACVTAKTLLLLKAF